MKNIVICSDGTNNQLEGDLTNVVRLYQIAVNSPQQAVFYDAGVGTSVDPNARGPIAKRWSLVAGLAFGNGLEQNVLDAYRYLMDAYEEGDQIYLFGFSRGAFTVRVLAGLLHAVGLLHRSKEDRYPELWKHYRATKLPPPNASEEEKNAAKPFIKENEELRRKYTRPVRVKFLGPWDTVGSVGMYNANQSYPFSYWNDSVDIVRHAVSLDERRAAFRSNVFKADPTPLANGRPRVMNVWFPGVHSDIGGGYPWVKESGLAMIAFEWMVREAVEFGLLIDREKYQALLTQCPPNSEADMHNSLTGGWWTIEYLPARRWDWAQGKTIWRHQPNKERSMRETPVLHRSVVQRMEKNSGYRPASLPKDHHFPIEDTRPLPPP